MTPAPHDIAASFEAAAADARSAEDLFRQRAAAEIKRLESERVTAHRRVRLIRLLATAASGPGEDAIAAQKRRLCQEWGWSETSPSHAEVLDRMTPVCRAVASAVDGTADSSAIGVALGEVEGWFQEARRTPIYALFDQYVQETPVVDF